MARDNLDEVVQSIRDNLTPTGSLLPTLATSAPAAGGWLPCDGSSVAKTDYPSLYAVLGGTYGETTDTFTLPDLRGRLPMGTGANGAPALSGVGGAQQVTLTVDQLPAHAHSITDPGHTHTFTGAPHGHGVTDPGHGHAVTDPGHTHAAATQAATADSASGADTTSAGAGNTGSATTGVTVDSNTTGVTVDSATAGGSNSSETTGITVSNAGGDQPVDIIPPVVGVNWLVRT